eukprot:CAMPEP_0119077714 /NCGR_PEP_ID=MMETSP1178-20130426/95861_1 /TAXON_ID=33656 /ORGANISM="unid sp, Strain CCMP2000" /LENGTH=137 /DNA_ID=CAMNT_0007060097 /DNA_START=231 /DNA_END=644 /DNA_ORIENTATION=+
MPGFSPLEPAFASIVPAKGDECHGAVFELTPTDWARLCLSEGVGVPTGYRVRQVSVELYSGRTVQAYTLSTSLLRAPVDLPPSERYLGLIRKGARELKLTGVWQDRLAAVKTAPFGTPTGRDSPLREYSRGAGTVSV